MTGKNTRETVLVGISVIRREQEIVLPREECPAGSIWCYVMVGARTSRVLHLHTKEQHRPEEPSKVIEKRKSSPGCFHGQINSSQSW